MLTVLFFAKIREQLGESRLQCAHFVQVDALIDALSERGEHWGDVLRAPNVIVAINQAVAKKGQLLRDGDEVAFYPPVTGG